MKTGKSSIFNLTNAAIATVVVGAATALYHRDTTIALLSSSYNNVLANPQFAAVNIVAAIALYQAVLYGLKNCKTIFNSQDSKRPKLALQNLGKLLAWAGSTKCAKTCYIILAGATALYFSPLLLPATVVVPVVGISLGQVAAAAVATSIVSRLCATPLQQQVVNAVVSDLKQNNKTFKPTAEQMKGLNDYIRAAAKAKSENTTLTSDLLERSFDKDKDKDKINKIIEKVENLFSTFTAAQLAEIDPTGQTR